MHFAHLKWIALLPFLSGISLLNGELSVSFADVEEFTDFTIHGLFHQEDAEALFEKQIQIHWERRMKDLLAEGTVLEIHFLDIDMAGDMLPVFQGVQSHQRVIEDRYPPRLKFEFKLWSPDGELIAEGTENLVGRNFTFRFGRNPRSSDITFFYEFELLREWIKQFSREAPNTDPGNSTNPMGFLLP